MMTSLPDPLALELHGPVAAHCSSPRTQRPAPSSPGGSRRVRVFGLCLLLLLGWGLLEAGAQGAVPVPVAGATNVPGLNLSLNLGGGPAGQDLDVSLKILAVMTLLTLAPSIILLMTCFARIIIVLSFIRSALALPGAPSNQILIGIALFLTLFIMAPVWERIDQDALTPYRAGTITSGEALNRASVPLRAFMLRQARPKDVELFVSLAKLGPVTTEELPMKVVVPGFIISELRSAFQMGCLLLIPFILIDLVVGTVLMSMGMMMMPPATVALPLKILLFVLVDGWNLIVVSLVRSFGL